MNNELTIHQAGMAAAVGSIEAGVALAAIDKASHTHDVQALIDIVTGMTPKQAEIFMQVGHAEAIGQLEIEQEEAEKLIFELRAALAAVAEERDTFQRRYKAGVSRIQAQAAIIRGYKAQMRAAGILKEEGNA